MAWDHGGWTDTGEVNDEDGSVLDTIDVTGMAVRLTEGGTTFGYWQSTSTSTIRVQDGEADVLRMYTGAGRNWSAAFGDWDFDGLRTEEPMPEGRLWLDLQEPPEIPDFPRLPALGRLARRLQGHPAYLSWFESKRSDEADALEFEVDSDGTEKKTTSTWIPTVKLNQRLPLRVIADTTGAWETITPRCAVFYADPCCVAMPSTSANPGYLMLLARYRVPHCAGGREPDEAASDIVAYWAPDAGFASGQIRGPFLLVRSTGALPDTDLRMWMGVPGGVLTSDGDDDVLFLYYICVQIAKAGETNLYTGEQSWCVPFDDADWYNAELAAYDATTTEGDPPYPLANDFDHIAARRVMMADLDKAITQARRYPDTPLIDEAQWDDEDAVEVPGMPLGHIRIWVPTDGSSLADDEPEVEDFLHEWGREVGSEDELLEGDFLDTAGESSRPSKVGKVVDPAPTVCEGQLSVYFCFRQGPEETDDDYTGLNGHGIWRAAALPGGMDLTWRDRPDGGVDSEGVPTTSPGTWTTVYGRDFVVQRASSSDEVSPDQVAVSGGPIVGEVSQVYADPDPVELSDGGDWAVFIGANCLWRIEGTHEDGCRSWDAAWSEEATVRMFTLSDAMRDAPGPQPIRLGDTIAGGLDALRPYGMQAWLARAAAARPPATSPG